MRDGDGHENMHFLRAGKRVSPFYFPILKNKPKDYYTITEKSKRDGSEVCNNEKV
jgi:hypothetical protein